MSKDSISDFIQAALAKGNSRDEIHAALISAGWGPREIDTALAGWHKGSLSIPVPVPQAQFSSREFFFYGLLFACLCMATFNLADLGRDIIDGYFADYRQYRLNNIRYAIAAIITFGGVFLGMSIKLKRDTNRDPSKRRSLMRRWVAYISLLLVALTLMGCSVYVIYTFLTGGLTLAFSLKTGWIVLVASPVAYYFRDELRGVEHA